MSVHVDRRSEGLLTDNTLVEVVYRKDGARYVLAWDQGGAVHPIARLDRNERIDEEGNIRERFPARIYSQKQLFALAQDPDALLTVIDDAQTIRKVELNRSLKQLEARYLSLRAEARLALGQADDLPAQRASLEDIQRKLDVLQADDHAQILNEYRVHSEQNGTWQEILRDASQAVESVERAAEGLLVADLSLLPDIEDDQSTPSLRRVHAALKQAVERLQKGVSDRVRRTRGEVEEIRTGAEASRWQTAVEASESRFREASVRLAEEGITNSNEYGDLLERGQPGCVGKSRLCSKSECGLSDWIAKPSQYLPSIATLDRSLAIGVKTSCEKHPARLSRLE